MATLMEGHIEVDAGGTARVAGSRIKVIHLVMEKTANRWSAEELAAAFPHLTPAQVHAALAYYSITRPRSTPRSGPASNTRTR